MYYLSQGLIVFILWLVEISLFFHHCPSFQQGSQEGNLDNFVLHFWFYTSHNWNFCFSPFVCYIAYFAIHLYFLTLFQREYFVITSMIYTSNCILSKVVLGGLWGAWNVIGDYATCHPQPFRCPCTLESCIFVLTPSPSRLIFQLILLIYILSK